MRDFDIHNLMPSDIEYLKADNDKQTMNQLREQLRIFLRKDYGVCAHSLDQVFSAAVMLSNCGIVEKMGVKRLDEIFNRRVSATERVEAFVEGLGNAYTGAIKLAPEQRRFTHP